MNLVYRGVAYVPHFVVIPTLETPTFATYRGLSYNYHRPVKVPTASQVPLKYRGIRYQTESPQPPQQFSQPFN